MLWCVDMVVKLSSTRQEFLPMTCTSLNLGVAIAFVGRPVALDSPCALQHFAPRFCGMRDIYALSACIKS